MAAAHESLVYHADIKSVRVLDEHAVVLHGYVQHRSEHGRIVTAQKVWLYVVVDDKPFLLAEIKAALGERVTTVFVRQGHYARDGIERGAPAADVMLASIAELADLDMASPARTTSQQESA